jgi:hypothetical protein
MTMPVISSTKPRSYVRDEKKNEHGYKVHTSNGVFDLDTGINLDEIMSAHLVG